MSYKGLKHHHAAALLATFKLNMAENTRANIHLGNQPSNDARTNFQKTMLVMAREGYKFVRAGGNLSKNFVRIWVRAHLKRRLNVMTLTEITNPVTAFGQQLRLSLVTNANLSGWIGMGKDDTFRK